MKLKNFLLLIFMLSSAFAMVAQDVTFVAKVSKSKLGVNEKVRIDFEMNQDGDNFTPPDFDGFLVIGGPNQAISNSYYNGRRSYSKTYSYFLQPQKQGVLTIDQATITINGNMFKTNPVKVTITAPTSAPSDSSNPDFLADESVHLVADISNTNPYLNEAITVTYRLYVSKDVAVTSNWREVATPKYADFWSQNIDSRGNYKIYTGEYKGKEYRYINLRSTILYPQKTGTLELEPLSLNVPVDVPTSKRDFFGRPAVKRVNKLITAGKRSIEVKPIPLEGRPDNYVDAVGQFQFDVRPSTTTLDAAQSLEYKIQVSGQGNLKLLTLPAVKLPSSLEVYEPERTENIKIKTGGMAGDVASTYTVVPQFKGTYPINPISFSYFDPRTERFETITSSEVVIEVPNGPVSNIPTDAAGNEITDAPALKQFKNIKLATNLSPINNGQFFKTGLYWALVGGPFLLIPLFVLLGRARDKRNADATGNRLRAANKLAKKYLSEAKKNAGDNTKFYDALERALHNYLKATLNIETSEMSKERILTLLQARGVSSTTIESFISLLKSCEFARYTPSSNVTIQNEYDKAVSVISKIDKEVTS